MSLSLETVKSLAPDQASLKAAGKLLKPQKWPLLGVDSGRGLVWGECQGSSSTPYRTVFDLADHGYKCTCPSRKFPCKHTLALIWQHAESGLPGGAPPDWVEEWLTRRRGRRAPAVPSTAPAATKDLAAALVTEEKTLTPEEQAERDARIAKAAEKRREKREQNVLGALEDLEVWLGDVLAEGVGRFPETAVDRCRQVAARLVDGQCAPLARQLDELPGRLFAVPDAQRARWLLDELGLIVLLVQAYRRRDALPEGLHEDVRRRIGWATKRQELLEDADALRVTGTWTVLGVFTEHQVDHLVRHETWLRRHEGAEWAVLVDYVPQATASAPPFAAGEVFGAELVFYPSAVPLRALIAKREPTEASPDAALHGGLAGPEAAWAHVQLQLAKLPWLTRVPVLLHGVRIGQLGRELVVVDPARPAVHLRLRDFDKEALLALAATGPCTLAGLAQGQELVPLAARSAAGWWCP